MADDAELRRAYRVCRELAARHYENFVVIGRTVPRSLRPHLAALYAFARGVDDLGDEHPGDRRRALDAWEEELRRAFGAGRPRRPEFVALAATVRRFSLPIGPFLDLIEANRRDQEVTDYADFDELLDYCRHSANPVGRLVLRLFGYDDEARAELSDATCTALQLTNFWQDVADDVRRRGRLYVPRRDYRRHGLERADFATLGPGDPRVRALFEELTARTFALFERGRALEGRVAFRLRLQLRLYRLGGEAILHKLRRQGYDPFAGRPTLSRGEKLALAASVLVAPTAEGRRAG
jgi:squalene synthase HpnC